MPLFILKRLYPLCYFLLGYFTLGFSQVNSEKYQLHVKRATDQITIDGLLNEDSWQQAERANNFIQNFPTDSLPATSQTEIMITYDDDNIYFAGICQEPPNTPHIIQSLRRDFLWFRNENFSFYFDPFDDYTNGFTFGITPAGIQREGLVTNGQDVSSDWDNKWFSEVKNYNDRWEFEMAIPFKTIRYSEGNDRWNMIFLRQDLKNNERSSWAPVPQGFRPSSFAFSGKLIFDEPLKKSGPNISVIPYLSGQVFKDHEEGENTTYDGDVGFDAKVAVSSSLNLDLTVNPDFSQVEVDQQVTNLSRFELFFPERRQFFLENNDLFGQNGFPSSRPFFSRRIGIAQDTADNRVLVPINFGARLSGKMGKNWRVGLLNMQTRKTDGARLSGADEIDGAFKLPAQNYTVAVFQRKIFARSNIGALVVNRQAVSFNEGDSSLSSTKYNRVYGVDYNLLSSNNKWEGNAYYHRSVSPDNNTKNHSTSAFLRYSVRTFNIGMVATSIGENYNAEVGFVPRKDLVRLGTFSQYLFYPKSSIINNHGPRIEFFHVTDQDFNRTDQNVELSYGVQLLNTGGFGVAFERRYEKLRDDFDPTGQGNDEEKLADDTDYSWQTVSAGYTTDQRKLLSADVSVTYGGFYDSKRFNFNGVFNYRYQPYGSIALTVDYNDINRPEVFQDAQFWLIGPRIDLTFTDKLFLTTFVQYNEQDDNVNVNARFQWRFKPVSDLFVVYTDNYLPDNLNVKNRALVVKLSYWLNI